MAQGDAWFAHETDSGGTNSSGNFSINVPEDVKVTHVTLYSGFDKRANCSIIHSGETLSSDEQGYFLGAYNSTTTYDGEIFFDESITLRVDWEDFDGSTNDVGLYISGIELK